MQSCASGLTGLTSIAAFRLACDLFQPQSFTSSHSSAHLTSSQIISPSPTPSLPPSFPLTPLIASSPRSGSSRPRGGRRTGRRGHLLGLGRPVGMPFPTIRKAPKESHVQVGKNTVAFCSFLQVSICKYSRSRGSMAQILRCPRQMGNLGDCASQSKNQWHHDELGERSPKDVYPSAFHPVTVGS